MRVDRLFCPRRVKPATHLAEHLSVQGLLQARWPLRRTVLIAADGGHEGGRDGAVGPDGDGVYRDVFQHLHEGDAVVEVGAALLHDLDVEGKILYP